MNKYIIIIISLFTIHFSLFTIEVGGHLTEDTTWSKDNNPYLVTSVVYVDQGVTLTIEPGTEVLLNAALLDNDTYPENFVFTTTAEPIAKLIIVDGRIIAEGTEEDNILFSRIQQDSTYYRWGIIFHSEESDISRYKYCKFEYSHGICFNLLFQPFGALVFQNSAIIKSCTFVDNDFGISFFRPLPTTKSIIKNNSFSTNEGTLVDPFFHRAIMYSNQESLSRIWVANNTFNDLSTSFSTTLSYVNNRHIDSKVFINNSEITSPAYIYDNHLLNSSIIGESETGSSSNELDSTYIRKNTIEKTDSTASTRIELYGYGYFEVSDNIVHGSIENTDLNSTGKVFNNIVHDGYGIHLGFYDMYNNISINNHYGLQSGWRLRNHYNNIYINNRYALKYITDYYKQFQNSIFIGNEDFVRSLDTDTLFISNCIIDSIRHEVIISGNNNIFIDSTQINDVFVDFENNNFHLMDGSIAIDAGQEIIDSAGHFYYNSFDLDNSYRIWDGDGDGIATRDIGLYEYNSQQFGTIQGQITESSTGVPVDFVLLKVNNDPGVFEFSDSLGYYEIKLPAGTYNLYAERIFCEDKVVSNITVIDGQITDIDFEMVSELIVGIKEEKNNYELSIMNYQLKQNYPNPFNPTTKISFQLPIANFNTAEIVVYNSAGQQVWSSKPLSLDTNYCTFGGSQFNSGIYFYSLIIDGETISTKSMVMIK